MKYKFTFCLILVTVLLSCQEEQKPQGQELTISKAPVLTLSEANRLADLPLNCMQVEYPNKLGQTLNDSTHLRSPKSLHPAFYGCFDWHSSVHGHWSLVSLLKQFPNLGKSALIREKLRESLSEVNIAQEMAYFEMTGNISFERTYGWAWILKLSEELHTWDDPMAKELEVNLEPLTRFIVASYESFLPKLIYPVRVGEHSNTAFGLSLAWDYALAVNDVILMKAIKDGVDRFYTNDVGCPMDWEPSGFDFLSPCLEEVNLVRKVYAKDAFKKWLDTFMPQLADPNFKLAPGKVVDRTDGKLVHLDGLNFSRAWCLYGIVETLPEYAHLKNIANAHINYSLPNIVDDNYGGTHWLGTFALYSLNKTK
ncbi:MAG: hypothetical protein ACI815_001059 [Psychroserpens sp.]|jgi:hypothetical protein